MLKSSGTTKVVISTAKAATSTIKSVAAGSNASEAAKGSANSSSGAFKKNWSVLKYPKQLNEHDKISASQTIEHHHPNKTHAPVTRDIADLGKTFFSGQAFSWARFGPENSDREIFKGVCHGQYFELRYADQSTTKEIEWRGTGTAETLADYLSMHIDYAAHFEPIAKSDPIFADRYYRNQGLRVMRQDPWECLIAFICSQNNNVKRIGQMVRNLCKAYGPLLYTDTESKQIDEEGIEQLPNNYYGFPEPDILALVEDEALRKLGFGYRAPYMIGASRMIVEKGGRSWLNGLRGKHEGRELLQELPGVGPKVSDCICIYALDLLDTVPLDVHMKRVAAEIYKIKSLNYEATRLALVQKLGGKYAGIGQTFMFASAVWRDPLPAKVPTQKDSNNDTNKYVISGKLGFEFQEGHKTEAKPAKNQEENDSTRPTKRRGISSQSPSPIPATKRTRIKRSTD
jgi:8-oxoguanine DNA-glycosylase Ogg